MKRRTLLKGQLIDAWNQCIEIDYPKRIINGERALQACLYHRLTTIFELDGMGGSRRIFIEPTMKLLVNDEPSTRMPDMVICDTQKVIGIFELKFHPRVGLNLPGSDALAPGTEKDMQTLIGVANALAGFTENQSAQENAHVIEVSNARYRGEGDGAEDFKLADNVLLGWMGIYSARPSDSTQKNVRLSDCLNKASAVVKGGFLELHAEAHKGKEPTVSSHYSGWK